MKFKPNYKKNFFHFLKGIALAGFILVVIELGLRYNDSLIPQNEQFPLGNNKEKISALIIGDSVAFRIAEILQSSIKPKIVFHNMSKPYFHIDNYPLSDMSEHIKKYRADAAILMLGSNIDLASNQGWVDEHFFFLKKYYVGRFLLEQLKSVVKLAQFNKARENGPLNFSVANLDIFLERLNTIPYFEHSFKRDAIRQIEQEIEHFDELDKGRKKLALKFLMTLQFKKFAASKKILEILKSKGENFRTLTLLTHYLALSMNDYELAQKQYLDLKSKNENKELACFLLSRELYLKAETDFAKRELESCAVSSDNYLRQELLTKLSLLYFKLQDVGTARKYAANAITQGQEKKSTYLWEAYYSYSLTFEGKERLKFLKKAIELNPNNYNMLRNAEDSVLTEDMDPVFLKNIREQSVYHTQIDNFLDRYSLKNLSDNEKKESLDKISDARKRFGMAMGIGAWELADLAYLEIGESGFEELKNKEIEEYRSFYELAKKHNMYLLVMQKPNQNLLTLKRILGEDPAVTYFDTYSFLRHLIETQQMSSKDLFWEDGNHLTEKGSNIIAQKIKSILEARYP